MPRIDGGFLDVAIGALQGGDDQLLSPSPAGSCRRGSPRFGRRRCWARKAKSSSVEDLSAAGDDGALDGVLQLADVAGPVVIHQQPERAFGDLADVLAELVGEALEEMSGEQRDVLAALAQRRDADLDDVQPVEEILAELALRRRPAAD